METEMVKGGEVCVVIPYFQRSPEPLKRALDSVFAQECVSTPFVLIVDDQSPFSAASVVETHFQPQSEHIRIISQKNSGAAKARNTGLDNLPEGTKYVAFLDSDDEWTPFHLDNAVRMFDSGCDFYFAGHKRGEWKEDKFSMIGFDPASHPCMDESRGLHEYRGDLIVPVMQEHMVQTSSVVYRLERIPAIRFPVDLVLGEDEVFWVKAMRLARKTGFCRHVEVQMGRGVNISQGGEWGSERALQLTSQNMLYWRRITDLLPEERDLGPLQKLRIRQLRRNLAEIFLYRLRRGADLPMRQFAACTCADPLWLFGFWNVLFDRIMSRREGKPR